MALEQKLSLKLSQRLVMTPSLQQAIKLLQMTRLELEGVLSQELEENPVLETGEDAGDSEAPETAEAAEGTSDDDVGDEDQSSMDDIDLDAYFNEYLDDGPEYSPSMGVETREAVPLENTLSEEPDLYDHLLWQLHMMDVPPLRREIAELIIGNLDADGFLAANVEELQLLGAAPEDVAEYRRSMELWERTLATADDPAGNDGFRSEDPEDASPAAIAEPDGARLPPAAPPEPPGYPRSEVEEALALVRSLDPPGVGCRDLRESLLEQLDRLGERDTLAFRMLDEHWPLFLKRQFQQIAKRLGVALQELEEPVNRIKRLETRPGRQFGGQRAQYVEPDVSVVKVGDEYVIQLNDDGLPRLRVSRAYRQMLRKMRAEGRQRDAQQFIKEKMRSAMWLIKSLDQRQRTIYKVAESIVRQQRAFLDLGIEHLRPMVLRDVADDIGMHESTVSRVVSNKYIHTPRGLFPMKFFFHSGIDREYGEDISSLTVKRRIQQMISEEDPKKPLSDSEIMRRLKAQGINIARRTVAKYRDELGIPSSTDRKQVF